MTYFIQTIACSAIFYLAFHFLFKGKNEHVFNRFYLLSSILLAMIIPCCQIPVFPEYITVIQESKPIVNIVRGTAPTGYSLSWEDALFALYILGITIHSLLLIIRLLRIAKLVKSGEKEHTNGITKVITSGNIPVSSFLSYLFIPKKNEASITAYELYHEEIHIRQKHSWDILFMECLRVIFWFNPFMILYKKRLVEIHEFLADEHSSKRFGQESYEQFLAMKTSHTKPQQLIHNFYSLFEKRIKMMNSNISTSKWQYAFILPMIAMTLMAFSFENYPVYNVQNPDQPTSYSQDTIPPELEGQEIDTIIIFDPVTKEETIEYVISVPQTGIDTILSFNTDDFSETIVIVNHDTGQRDSIKQDPPTTGVDTLVIFDPVDFHETIIIMNHETGQRDTLK